MKPHIICLLVALVVAISACGSSTPHRKPDPAPAPAKSGGSGGGTPPVAEGPTPSETYACTGFVTFEAEGRLWVFREGEEALEDFRTSGEPAKRITRIGRGPGGMTIMGAEGETLDAYEAAVRYGRPGFAVFGEDGRVWVFREGSEDLDGFLSVGEPAKRVTRIGRGPDGKTVMAPDTETLDAYASAWTYGRPGFAVFGEDGRLWVFRDGSEDLEGFLSVGEPAKRTTRVGAGPEGMTIMGPDVETIEGYMTAWTHGRPGFAVFGAAGRLWVFRDGSEDLASYLTVGDLVKRVTRVGVGPEGRTVIAPDGETIEAYLASAGPSHEGPGSVASRFAGPERPGFEIIEKNGRLWVFRAGSDELREFRSGGEPAKRITRIGAGPEGETVLAVDRETLDSYAASLKYGKPGFAVFMEDGRLWIFRDGSEDLRGFLTVGEPAKRITRIGAGPDGKTVMAPDGETLDAFLGR
jgi:hypothetical protein